MRGAWGGSEALGRGGWGDDWLAAGLFTAGPCPWGLAEGEVM